MEKILEEFRDDILKNVNAKECAPELRRRHVIAESTETDIERARDAKTAGGVLYDHLHRHCTLEQIVVLSRVLMEVDSGFGRTKKVGQRLYTRIQGIDAFATVKVVTLGATDIIVEADLDTAGTVIKVGPDQSQHRIISTTPAHLYCSKKPTFAERDVVAHITKQGFYNWEWVYSAEAVDVASGIKAKAKNYQSKGGAKEHARTNLKAILVERGIICKD